MNYCVGDELFLSDKESAIILRVVPHIANRTNADRIRAMSAEELAEFIESQRVCQICNRRMNNCFPADVFQWLQQPAPEEGEQA